jgi:signal-transduction protein with cAMP-binding, CBS, and nucleotidyltransferase domain
MQLRDLLRTMPPMAATVTPQTLMIDAAAEMMRSSLQALLVMESGTPHGLLTCGDLLEWLVNDQGDRHRTVKCFVSTAPPTASPEQTIDEAVAEMTLNQMEHIVLLDKGRVMGMIELKVLHREQVRLLHLEVEHLHDYIDALHSASKD